MLSIDLRALREGVVQRTGRVGLPGEAWPEVPGEFVGPVELSVRAESGPDGAVRVAGRLAGTLNLRCRRCLDEVRETVSIAFDALFRPEGGESTPERVVHPLRVESGGLDLTEMLREELLLAVPGWSVCAADCRGLCPRCGVDRNVKGCDCVREEADPRWDALRALLGSG